ncbi:PTS sugar transporter subunit IIA [Faecalicoccus pleomorphus]|uniref:PTS sugar transporter subunit IIA n=1 Tax=Faecalicoccus pleomorphus TaxID=1323 RepID=UPI0024308969|nr:PTS fructose transporter subunit IIA [Faecalicoccus pleomorphus]
MAERKILLASHSYLAKGLKESAEFFLGKQESMQAICAYLDSSDDYLKEIQSFIDTAKEGEAIILTDIIGGSVNQQVVTMVENSRKRIPIISSMNLPIVLAVALSTGLMNNQLATKLCQDCEPKVVCMNEFNVRDKEGDLDEFFE